MNIILMLAAVTTINTFPPDQQGAEYELIATNFNKSMTYSFKAEKISDFDEAAIYKIDLTACLIKQNFYEHVKENLFCGSNSYKNIGSQLHFNIAQDRTCYMTFKKTFSKKSKRPTHKKSNSKNKLLDVVRYIFADTNTRQQNYPRRSISRQHIRNNTLLHKRRKRLIRRVYY